MRTILSCNVAEAGLNSGETARQFLTGIAAGVR
jgi:hypothetical protein